MLFHGVNSLKALGTSARGFLLLLCIGGHEPSAGGCSDARQYLGCPHCPDRPLRRHSSLAILPRTAPHERAGTCHDAPGGLPTKPAVCTLFDNTFSCVHLHGEIVSCG